MLKFVYSFFLGLLLALFVGFGVASFYQAPEGPEYPKVLEQTQKSTDEYTEEQKAADEQYRADSEAYSDRLEDYSRNVSVIVLGAAVVLVVLGLTLRTKTDVIEDGLLLGGTFTLLYSIGRSFAGGDPKYTFVVVTIGLLITVYVGYRKFINPPQPVKSGKKKK